MEGWMWIPLVIGFFWLWSWIQEQVEEYKRKEKERVYNDLPWKETALSILETYKKKIEKLYKKADFTEDLEEEMQTQIYEKVQAQSQRVCPSCKFGTLRQVKGRYGYFFGCTRYPTCRYTKNIGKIQTSVKKQFHKKAKESFTEDFIAALKNY